MKASDIVRKSGKTDGKSNRFGGGGRTKQMENKGMGDKLIAWIGRKNHGAKAMAKVSAGGKHGK